MAFRGTIHIDRALTNVSSIYANEADSYIADKIAPIVPVANETDSYFLYSSGHFRIDDAVRANGAEANEVDMHFSTGSYRLTEYALKMFVSDRDRENADAPLSLDIDATKVLTERILTTREFEVASLLFATASFANQLSVAAANQWSLDTTASDPLLIVNTATNVIVRTSGKRPNAVAMGLNPFLSLKRHQSVSDRIKYVERSIVTEDLLASLFDIDQVLVGKSVYDAAPQEGAGDASQPIQSLTSIWGQNALFAWLPPSPGLRMPSAVYMFAKQDDGMRLKVKKWREEKLAGDYIEVSTMLDPVVVSSNSGFYVSGVSA